MKKTKDFALKHKIATTVIAIVLIGLLYMWYRSTHSSTTQTRYILGTAATSTIISTVSGSGQVSAYDSIDIKPKVSAEVTWIGVQAGDTVRAGQALMTLDNTDAKNSVIAAEQNLATSKLQLQKDAAQAPIDYQNAQTSISNAQNDLATTYNDTYNSISGTYLDMPAVITGTQNVLYGYDMSPSGSQWNVDVLTNLFSTDEVSFAKMNALAESAKNDYATARALYDPDILAYKQTTRSASPETIDKLLQNTTDMTTAVAQALQSELNLLSTAIDIAQTNNHKLPATVTTLQTNARNYLSTINNDLSTLLSQKKAIDSDKQIISTDKQNITLLQVGNANGDNPISLQIEKNNINSAETNLEQLKANLADYTIVTPFDGIISAVNVNKGDTASGVVATVITKKQIATLSLNEVDAAKVNLGNKATLTFDAIDGLTISGSVIDKDPVGTVSQGVVNYTVKIGFDTQDSRVNPGMTVNASIITDVKQNVLSVPSSAVKTSNGISYVLAFNPPLSSTGDSQGVVSTVAPEQIQVATGASNDTNVEILSGLVSGQQIVIRTSTGSSSSSSSSSSSRSGTTVRGFGGPGIF